MHIPFRDQTQSIAEHAARLYQLLGYENLQFRVVRQRSDFIKKY